MQSVFDNGGIIGQTMDFASTEKYILSESIDTITQIGSVGGGAVNGGSITLSLTSLNLQEGDVLIIMVGAADSGAEPPLLPTTSGVTMFGSYLYGNDSEDITMEVGYYICGATPPTSMTSLSTGDADNSSVHIIQAYRGVDISSLPFLFTTATGINSSYINPPAITTSVNNSVVVCVGAASESAPYVFTSTDLSGFHSYVGGNDTYDGAGGMGYKEISTAGTFDAVQWSSSGSGSLQAWAGMSIVLEPKTIINYGNYKNSGIWKLSSVINSI